MFIVHVVHVESPCTFTVYIPPTHTYRLVQLPPFPFPIERDQLVHGLCEGVKLDVHFPGFPSLKHIHHTGQMEKRGVRVFQSASRGENLCLSITPKEIPEVNWCCAVGRYTHIILDQGK